LNWRAEENLVVNNKGNRVFLSKSYRLIVDPWKFDVLIKTNIFVLRTLNFRGATISLIERLVKVWENSKKLWNEEARKSEKSFEKAVKQKSPKKLWKHEPTGLVSPQLF